LVIDSMPPATTMELFSVWIACAASATALSPEPQTLFYGHGTHFRRQSAEDCGLARGILSQSGGDHVPMMAFVHLFRVESGALHRFADHDGAQLRGAQIGQASLEFFPPAVRQPEMMTTSS
jgi:hypothetical protein